MLVITNHALGWPSGGYIGVDVFFVISGYLISGILLRDLAQTGWISFAGFYARRLRRILPVATVVALSTVLAGFVLWYVPRANQTALDGLASLLWVSNWHFAAIGTDYLAASGPVSPFQHYWSLSVEEQFYVFWPWILLALASVATRFGVVSKAKLTFAGIAVFSIASFGLALYLTNRAPSVAYFETFSRSWEFAVGAAIAVVTPRLSTMPLWLSRALSRAGVLIILIAGLVLTPASAFPGPWAILPVIGAASVLAGGVRTANSGLLTLPAIQYVGAISYSIYLWHFPVLVFSHSIFPDGQIWSTLLQIGLIFVLSILSYRYVELPFRRSRWLRSWERHTPERTAGFRRKQVWAASFVAVTVVVMAVLQVRGPDGLTDATALSPSKHIAMDTCRNKAGNMQPQICHFGPAASTKTVLVLGDSVAVSWIPTVASAFPERTVTGLGFANCSPYALDTLPRQDDGSFVEACRNSKQLMLKQALDLRPDLVILSSDLGGFERIADGSRGDAAADRWTTAVTDTVASFRALGTEVVVLGSPPIGGDVRDCTTRITAYENCGSAIAPPWSAKTKAEENGAVNGGARFVDVRNWFCDADGSCPPIINGMIVRTDPTHTTDAFAASLGDKLDAALGSLGQ